jgi:hypothetical protein
MGCAVTPVKCCVIEDSLQATRQARGPRGRLFRPVGNGGMIERTVIHRSKEMDS